MIRSESIIVTTTRQAITDPDIDRTAGTRIWLYAEYHGSSNKCAIGGSDVTIDNGIHLYHSEKFGPIQLAHGESLWIVSDSEIGVEMRVLFTSA